MSQRVVCIVQARTSSTRFPGKVLECIAEKPMIVFLLERLQKSSKIDSLILATSTDRSDDKLAKLVSDEGYKVFRGSLKNVLLRYYTCALKEKAEIIIRITGDCPLMDHNLINEILEEFIKKGYDYISNSIDNKNLSIPDGYDIEIFKFSLLEKALESSNLLSEKEHVTPWFITKEANAYWSHYKHKPERNYFRLTVDHPIDLDVIREVVAGVALKDRNISIDSVINFLKINPSVSSKNINIIRNEGYIKSLKSENFNTYNSKSLSGQNLWKKAKGIIPGGNMLLSKRSEMFLPDNWPSYFSKAKGCSVWDLNNNELTDMIMAVGTNLLGYCVDDIDNAVSNIINKGTMSTLNCPEEVYLAEKLIELHPWSEMVRFARTGGEANAIAVRIARAATGKNTVAICGYHGWHDWYLSANLQNNNNLSEHLLSGLDANGVPENLSGTSIPFTYNNFKELKKISNNNDLAAIKMEVQRTYPPEPNFLESIRKLCNEKGIVLIFDECTSGFRETNGGLHKKYKIEPDMAMFGKALGNGYPITAIIGKKSIMEAAQNTFISSTFWTERIGSIAGLKTLEIMKKTESWKIVTHLGKYLSSQWKSIADRNNLDIDIHGIYALLGFKFNSDKHLFYKTFITQEMLKRGYLASTSCYLSTAHNKNIIDRYIENLDEVFAMIRKIEEEGDLNNKLEGPISHSSFKRLN